MRARGTKGTAGIRSSAKLTPPACGEGRAFHTPTTRLEEGAKRRQPPQPVEGRAFHPTTTRHDRGPQAPPTPRRRTHATRQSAFLAAAWRDRKSASTTRAATTPHPQSSTTQTATDVRADHPPGGQKVAYAQTATGRRRGRGRRMGNRPNREGGRLTSPRGLREPPLHLLRQGGLEPGLQAFPRHLPVVA